MSNNNTDTPAPLDPSKVKAGDTVTVSLTDYELGTYEVSGTVRATSGGALMVGPTCIASNGTWRKAATLTDHQPAPKPEWGPGTSGTATALSTGNVHGFWHLAGPHISDTDTFAFTSDEGVTVPGRYVSDFVPDEARPLPTRDEVREALTIARHEHESHVATYPESDDGMRGQDAHQAEAIDALLRGESR
jgi:hypothetical protein